MQTQLNPYTGWEFLIFHMLVLHHHALVKSRTKVSRSAVLASGGNFEGPGQRSKEHFYWTGTQLFAKEASILAGGTQTMGGNMPTKYFGTSKGDNFCNEPFRAVHTHCTEFPIEGIP